MLSALLAGAVAVSSPATEAQAWTHGLDWHGVHVAMTRDDARYTLAWPYGQRLIPAAAAQTQTASVLFDGLFAMAQDDLAQDSVSSIRDDAFDHGQPIPCHCFETGLKWPYVWTRDLAYAVDLGLGRFDPTRARNGLAFKLSGLRAPSDSAAVAVMQDTGSGGSWPISTDRVVWFLGARQLLDDAAFAARVWPALQQTLAQDQRYAFDAAFGLYRGETSFLDWREQSYPAWTATNVTFIAQSFALSTNVLHFQALQLAATLAETHGERQRSGDYRAQADALKIAINAHFWRADRGLYMSYLGGDGAPFDSYDLLGTALAITSGVAEGAHAKTALANYPTWPAGSPVIWPERRDQPVYHNRAIWPFVSVYALRAARVVAQPARIAHEIRSVMRGAALYGSNMENAELLTQGQHVDEGDLSGPVVNSPRQLWSVAAYLAMVTEGVFGLTPDGRLAPELPTSLVPMLFGKRDTITLTLRDRRITLQLPSARQGNLLIADSVRTFDTGTTVMLKAIQVDDPPLRTDAPLYAPAALAAPTVSANAAGWRVQLDGKAVLYVNGKRRGVVDGSTQLARTAGLACLSVTRADASGLESLQSPATCVGDSTTLRGDWPRAWTAPVTGTYRVMLAYANRHGPINTGITAAVKLLAVNCTGGAPQQVPIVMPHSVAVQQSTSARFAANAGARCQFALNEGFNMSAMENFAHYTAGAGGSAGPLNQADVRELILAPLDPLPGGNPP